MPYVLTPNPFDPAGSRIRFGGDGYARGRGDLNGGKIESVILDSSLQLGGAYRGAAQQSVGDTTSRIRWESPSPPPRVPSGGDRPSSSCGHDFAPPSDSPPAAKYDLDFRGISLFQLSELCASSTLLSARSMRTGFSRLCYPPGPLSDAREARPSLRSPDPAPEPPSVYLFDWSSRGSGKGGASSVVEGGAPPVVEGGAPPVVEGGAPSVVEGGAPPVVEGGAPSAVEGGASSAERSTGNESARDVTSSSTLDDESSLDSSDLYMDYERILYVNQLMNRRTMILLKAYRHLVSDGGAADERSPVEQSGDDDHDDDHRAVVDGDSAATVVGCNETSTRLDHDGHSNLEAMLSSLMLEFPAHSSSLATDDLPLDACVRPANDDYLYVPDHTSVDHPFAGGDCTPALEDNSSELLPDNHPSLPLRSPDDGNVMRRCIRHFKSLLFGKLKYSDSFLLSPPCHDDDAGWWARMTLVLDKNFLRVVSMHPENFEQLIYEHLYMLYCVCCKCRQGSSLPSGRSKSRFSSPDNSRRGPREKGALHHREVRALAKGEMHHSLGERLYSFAMHWSEPFDQIQEVKHETLVYAMRLVHVEIRNFSKSVASYYGEIAQLMPSKVSRCLNFGSKAFFERVRSVVNEVFWTVLHERFLGLVRRGCLVEDTVYTQGLEVCQEMSLEELGVPEPFRLDGDRQGGYELEEDDGSSRKSEKHSLLSIGRLASSDPVISPYLDAVLCLRRLPQLRTPLSKLACLTSCFDLIHCAISSHYRAAPTNCPPLTGDDLLPVFLFVLIRSHVPNIHAECTFMELFITESQSKGQEGYSLATMQASLSLLNHLLARAH